MKNLKNKLIGAARRAHESFTDLKQDWGTPDPFTVVPYRGYASKNRLWLGGRVLEDENIFVGKTDSQIRNIINSFKRLESDEVPGVRVDVDINGRMFSTKTDQEGYFAIDVHLDKPIGRNNGNWANATVSLPGLLNTPDDDIHREAEIFLPAANADYGLISDVDDTVLQTHVTSMLRLRMLYVTFFKNAKARLPMEGIVDLYERFHKGASRKKTNPIFYVSNSPWNIYDILEDFMDIQQIPKGPLMLRDYGFSVPGQHKSLAGSKVERISHIMETFPKLPFLMLGDTASKDADDYIELAHKFPGRIKTIYIRYTRDTKNARRVAKLIEQSTNVDAVVIKRSAEIVEHARGKGYIV